MNSVLLIILDLFIVSNGAITHYECGEHGRFEYCIDGIPGCVIGCHCHPGYYFDTETKICEPNAKLIQAYKPQIVPERINAGMERNLSKINQQVDAITNDTSDISEWLYNQFFKTIENGVMNNTRNPVADTRRSGNDFFRTKKIPKQKTRPKRKKKKSKRKSKNNLRRKSLRISPDDSMFDEQDEKKYKSREDDDDGDDDDDDYSDEDKDEDSDDDDDSDVSKNESGDHGHKEFIMFSKTPSKPNLPSYILLPNMQSQFYPSIGLPPAPVMQPMIPVPPMFPYYGPPHSHDDSVTNDKKATTKTTQTAITQTATSENSQTTQTSNSNSNDFTTKAIPEDYTTTPEAINKPEPNLDMLKKKLRNGVWKPAERALPRKKVKIPRNSRNRLPSLEQRIRKLQEHLTLKNLNNDKNNISVTPLKTNTDVSLEVPYNGDYFSAVRRKWENDTKDDIDLNYLTDISTREDFNSDYVFSQKNLPETKTRRAMTTSPVYSVPKPISQHKNRISLLNDNENVYYTNLGKEIASLIKNMNSKLGKELILEVDEFHKKIPHKLHYDKFHNSPKSYWERSIRSPMKQLTKFDDVRKVNSKLFDIEDKVEEAVATTPKLSLRELENIINIVQNSHSTLIQNEEEKPSNTAARSLNIDLFGRKLDKNLSQTYLADNKYKTRFKSAPTTVTSDLVYQENVAQRNQHPHYSTADNAQRFHTNNRAAYRVQNYDMNRDDMLFRNADMTRSSPKYKMKYSPIVPNSYINFNNYDNHNQFYDSLSFPKLQNKNNENSVNTPNFQREYKRYNYYFD